MNTSSSNNTDTYPESSKPPKIAAVIFDMDGTMFDTEAMYQRGMARAGAELGYDIHHGIYLGTVGLPEIGWRTHLRNTFGPDFPLDEIARRTVDNVHAELERDGLPIKPGLLALLSDLDDKRIPCAIASSSKRKTIQRNLGLSGLQDRFPVIVGGEEVQHGKPAPDIFLEAARRLNIRPANCMVLEDSNAGIRAAHAAGMVAVMIPDLIPPSDELRLLARVVLPSLFEVSDWLSTHIATTNATA
jgi:HAD superfamily hydrolase (TIGR01509 family)